MINRKDLASLVLRISLALVFLYFGYQQVSNPDAWTDFVPEFISGRIMTANNLVVFNGILELSLGIFLAIGLYTRFAALILSVHLLFISLSIGVSPTGVRDFGLAFATFCIFLLGADRYCIDKKFGKKKD